MSVPLAHTLIYVSNGSNAGGQLTAVQQVRCSKSEDHQHSRDSLDGEASRQLGTLKLELPHGHTGIIELGLEAQGLAVRLLGSLKLGGDLGLELRNAVVLGCLVHLTQGQLQVHIALLHKACTHKVYN